MNSFARRSGLALISSLVIAGCSSSTTPGGPAATDGGAADSAAPDSAAPDSGGDCPAGTTTFTIAGTYATVVGSNIADGCNTGLLPADLITPRSVTYDAQAGTATVTSTGTGSILGSGPVKCNAGTLTFGPVTFADASCSWDTTRAITFTATGNNEVKLVVTDDRANTKQVAGGATCQQAASCTLGYTLTMSK